MIRSLAIALLALGAYVATVVCLVMFAGPIH